MSIFEAVILGIVQGLTEFLPVSSSGHIRVVAAFAGWPDPGAAFTAVSQIGTELAVLIYFRKDVWNIISAWTRSLGNKELRRHSDARIGWYIIIGTIPIGVLGLLFEEQISELFRDLRLIALTLIIFGVFLGMADRYARKHRELAELTVQRGVIYGLFQALALVPGVSRSGATVTGGMLLHFKREAAARYAFLLAMPAVFASGFYKLKDVGGDEYAGWGASIIATLVAFVIGYAVIAWFMRFISGHSFMPFVYYRIALGILILVLVSFDVIQPGGGSQMEDVSSEETTQAAETGESGETAEPNPAPSEGAAPPVGPSKRPGASPQPGTAQGGGPPAQDQGLQEQEQELLGE